MFFSPDRAVNEICKTYKNVLFLSFSMAQQFFKISSYSITIVFPVNFPV